jgi:hypothetical protein
MNKTDEEFKMFLKEKETRLLQEFVRFLLHHKLVDDTVYSQIYVFTELDKFMPYQIEDIKEYIDKKIIEKKAQQDFELARFWQQLAIESAKHSEFPDTMADQCLKRFKELFLSE